MITNLESLLIRLTELRFTCRSSPCFWDTKTDKHGMGAGWPKWGEVITGNVGTVGVTRRAQAQELWMLRPTTHAEPKCPARRLCPAEVLPTL